MWDNRLENNVPDPLRLPADEELPPSVVINPHSDLGKELRKWEQHPGPLTPSGTRPGNPYVYRPYPKMMYLADQGPNGQTASVLPSPDPWRYPDPNEHAKAQIQQESWNRAHQKIVRDESEERIAKGQGWANDPVEALNLYEARQQAFAEAAAQAAYQAQRMSDKARRELTEADAATDKHVVDVVPVKRRGRPAKGTKPVIASGPVED